MRKLIVITLALMALGIYGFRRPQKVAVQADSEAISDKCGKMQAELEKIKAELNKLEKVSLRAG